MMNKIDICYITDDKYILPTYISIFSIYQNMNKTYQYNVYAICKGVSSENKELLNKLNKNNFNVIIIEIDDRDLSKYKIENITATPTSMIKFNLSNIFEKLNKIIYLDGDTIVNSDLIDLYDNDITNYYAAAVKDCNALVLNLNNTNKYHYFNSGVMLLNLKKMRENNMEEKLVDYRKNGYNRLMDQDALNSCFNGNVLLIPFEYNTLVNTLSLCYLNISRYSLKDIKEYWKIEKNNTSIDSILKCAKIIHYESTFKPWKFFDGYGNDIWYYYYLKSPIGNRQLDRKFGLVEDIVNSKKYQIGIKISRILDKFKQEKKDYIDFLKKFYN